MFGISIPSLRGKRWIESGLFVTLILFGCLFLYLALGLPLAFVLGGVGMIGCLILWGPSGFMIASSQGYAAIGKFTLISIPLFVLMAMLLERSGVAEDLYQMMHNWLGPLGGGLAIGTVIICTIFAAMSGISGAATVSMGIIALPQMLKRNYEKKIAMGSISAGGALGILIPPSVIFISQGRCPSDGHHHPGSWRNLLWGMHPFGGSGTWRSGGGHLRGSLPQVELGFDERICLPDRQTQWNDHLDIDRSVLFHCYLPGIRSWRSPHPSDDSHTRRSLCDPGDHAAHLLCPGLHPRPSGHHYDLHTRFSSNRPSAWFRPSMVWRPFLREHGDGLPHAAVWF